MDRRVIERLKEAFALDLYETVRAARQVRGEKVFRHTLYEDGQAVFCGFYPKAELLEFPGVDEEFISRLSTFNLLGVITDGVTRLDLSSWPDGTSPSRRRSRTRTSPSCCANLNWPASWTPISSFGTCAWTSIP